jgi:hypothetical protein
MSKRDAEKWPPVFRVTHATTKNRDRDDVSIKLHPDLRAGKPIVDGGELRAEIGDHPAFGRGAVTVLPGDDAVEGKAVEERGFSGPCGKLDAAAGGEDW